MFLSKMFNCFLSHFVSVQVSDAYVNVWFIVVFDVLLLVNAGHTQDANRRMQKINKFSFVIYRD